MPRGPPPVFLLCRVRLRSEARRRQEPGQQDGTMSTKLRSLYVGPWRLCAHRLGDVESLLNNGDEVGRFFSLEKWEEAVGRRGRGVDGWNGD